MGRKGKKGGNGVGQGVLKEAVDSEHGASKNKTHDREMEHAFILGSMDCRFAKRSVLISVTRLFL
jgi:hypothetical protein